MGRDFNAAIGEIFPADELLKMGYDLKDLADANMLNKILFDKMAYETRNRNQLASILTSLSDFSMGSPETMVTWNAGDEEASTTELTAPYTVTGPAGTGAATIGLAIDSLVDGNYVLLHEANGAGPQVNEVLLRINDIKSAGVYPVTVIEARSTTTPLPTRVYAVATTQVSVLATTTQLDGRAGDPNTIVPVVIGNYMERIRESGIVGTHTNAGNMNFDGGINAQMRLKMKTFLERLNLTLALRQMDTNPQVVAGNVGRMKGFMNFFNPWDRTASMTDTIGNPTGMTGKNAVFSAGGTIDRGEIEDWLVHQVAYGSESNEKILVGTPDFINKIYRSLLTDVTVNQNEFRLPGSAKVWKGITIELITGTLHLVPDFSLQNTEMYIQDNTIHGDSATPTAANTKNWGICIDPKFTKLIYKDAPADPVDAGIQKPAIRNVDSYGADSRVQKEANASLTLWIKRSETGGFVCQS